MTKKRFTKVEHIFEMNDEGVKDNNTKIDYYYALDMIDLLNELAEEKEIAIDGIKIADDLISRFGSDELKHEWKKEVIVKYR